MSAERNREAWLALGEAISRALERAGIGAEHVERVLLPWQWPASPVLPWRWPTSPGSDIPVERGVVSAPMLVLRMDPPQVALPAPTVELPGASLGESFVRNYPTPWAAWPWPLVGKGMPEGGGLAGWTVRDAAGTPLLETSSQDVARRVASQANVYARAHAVLRERLEELGRRAELGPDRAQVMAGGPITPLIGASAGRAAPRWDGPRWSHDGPVMWSAGDPAPSVMAHAAGLAAELVAELNAREVAALPAVAAETQRRTDLAAEFDRRDKARDRRLAQAQARIAELEGWVSERDERVATLEDELAEAQAPAGPDSGGRAT